MYPSNDYRDYLLHSDEDLKYGLPEKKKYPMPDRDHVMSAIKFFNYVSPSDEKELARNILLRIKEYGIEDINVGENNRFGKYYPDNDYRSYLEHGTKGLHWAWPDHKYLEKTVEGVYLYTKEQVENARKKGKQFVSSVSNAVKDTKDKVSTSFSVNEDVGSSIIIILEFIEIAFAISTDCI